MPSCSATWRASYTLERTAAARLGLHPGCRACLRDGSDPKLQREADHCCPRVARIAATVEESTPPDMATAMVFGSGMGIACNSIFASIAFAMLNPLELSILNSGAWSMLVPRFKRLERVVRASTVGIDVNRKVCSGQDLLIVRDEARAGGRRPLPFWLCRR